VIKILQFQKIVIPLHQLRTSKRNKIMIQDIIIRAEFLIEDLRKSICVGGDFNSNIVNAWKDDIRYLIHNGMEGEEEQIYDFNNKEDLKECIDMGMEAEDIAYLVNQYRENDDNTQFFRYTNGITFGLHILSKQDVFNAIDKQIENIAYNTLKYPYKGAYAELYREFVVPMIDNTKG
jgi:hypothetical protein